MSEKKSTKKYYEAVGRRKSAVARVRIYEKGKGSFMVNDKSLKDFFSFFDFENQAISPLISVGLREKFDVTVKVSGGGLRGQAEAIRHGLSRALVKIDEKNKTILKKQGFLTRDPRKKERKKPGLKRARRAPQWRKR